MFSHVAAAKSGCCSEKHIGQQVFTSEALGTVGHILALVTVISFDTVRFSETTAQYCMSGLRDIYSPARECMGGSAL